MGAKNICYDYKKTFYIDKLLAKQWNGKVKIITGLRRCGKSFLLSTLYKNRLLEDGVNDDKSTIEIFADNGAAVMTALTFFGFRIDITAVGYAN